MPQDTKNRYLIAAKQWQRRTELLQASLRELLAAAETRSARILAFERQIDSDPSPDQGELDATFADLRREQFELERRVGRLVREESERML